MISDKGGIATISRSNSCMSVRSESPKNSKVESNGYEDPYGMDDLLDDSIDRYDSDPYGTNGTHNNVKEPGYNKFAESK